jgi:hypothetical protein
MRKFITDKCIEMHANCTTDKYGQVHRDNFVPSIFGERAEEVMTYCRNWPGLLKFDTYGGMFGPYTAFTIESDGLKRQCREALHKNENYIRNINRAW